MDHPWNTAVREPDYWIEWRTASYGYVVRRITPIPLQENEARYDVMDVRDIREDALREAIKHLVLTAASDRRGR